MEQKDLLGWLQLLDVALEYADQIRQHMVEGTPGTKEQFTKLNEQFYGERSRVQAIVDAMPDTDPLNLPLADGTKLV